MWAVIKDEWIKAGDRDIINQAIIAVLEEQPFSPVRELTKRTDIPLSMVHRRLTNSMGFVLKHVRWIPHKLNEAISRLHRLPVSNHILGMNISSEPEIFAPCHSLDALPTGN
jgi:hypothetical protein